MTTIHSGSGEVLEVAVLSVRPGVENDFENAFCVAQALIAAASPGCQGHQLRRSLEVPSQNLRLVRWRTLEDHTIGFRQSAPYLTVTAYLLFSAALAWHLGSSAA